MDGSVPSQDHREGHNFPVVPTKGSQNTRLKPLLPRPASAAEPAGERLTIRIRVRLQAYRSDATVTHAPIRRNDPNRLVEKELASVDIAVQIAKLRAKHRLNQTQLAARISAPKVGLRARSRMSNSIRSSVWPRRWGLVWKCVWWKRRKGAVGRAVR